jgi:hypothetical protein
MMNFSAPAVESPHPVTGARRNMNLGDTQKIVGRRSRSWVSTAAYDSALYSKTTKFLNRRIDFQVTRN